jgi:type I restriction enzyme S subunit
MKIEEGSYKEKALAPRLKFKGFEGRWTIKTFDEIVDVIDCKHRTPHYVENGIPVISPGTIKWGEIDLVSPTKRVVESEYESLMDHCDPKIGDLVFSRNQSIGVASILLKKDKFVLGQDTVLIQAKYVDSIFNYFRLQTDSVQALISKLSGGSTFARINLKDLRKIKVAIADSNLEQQKIASFLLAIDEKIQKLTWKKILLEKYKKSVMQKLFTLKVRFKDEAGKSFPKWEEKRLGEIVATPISDGPHTTPKFISNGIPFLSVNNLVDNKIDFNNVRQISKEDHEVFSKKCKPQKGDVLLGKAASVGKIAIVETDMEFNIWSPIAMIRVKNNISSKFIYYSFQTPLLIRQIESSTNSSSQGNIGMGDIGKLKFILPSEKKEQKRIADYLANIDKKIESVTKQITQTQAFKKGLLQKMFV